MKKVLSVVIALLVLSLCVSCLAVLVSAETSQAGDTAGSASQQIETSAQPSPQAAAGENEDRAAGGTGAAEAKADLGEDPGAPSPANGSSGIIAFSLLAVIGFRERKGEGGPFIFDFHRQIGGEGAVFLG